MKDLIEKANQAILEAQWLRHEGRRIRGEAAARASGLDETMTRVRTAEAISRAILDHHLSQS